MKRLKRSAAALLLMAALSVVALAGEMDLPGSTVRAQGEMDLPGVVQIYAAQLLGNLSGLL